MTAKWAPKKITLSQYLLAPHSLTVVPLSVTHPDVGGCRGAASHQLSATALLSSPDGSRHPLDLYEFTEEDFAPRRAGPGLWECLVGCRQRVDQQLARRRVSHPHLTKLT